MPPDHLVNTERMVNEMPVLSVIMNNMEKENIGHYRKRLELLYDNYLQHVYGFLVSQTYCKKHSEESLVKVFLKVWTDIKTFDEDNAEKEIILAVILTCRHNA